MSSRKNKMELNILNEAFRILKSNILFCSKDNKIKSITITSCNVREGKTTVSLNLAVSLAASDIKTLLIDSEFRKQKNQLDEANIGAGLVKSIKDTNISNLKYLSIASSFSNPERFIDSAQLKRAIDDLSEKYDMIIIDAPPLRGVIDSALIAANTDATILVIKPGLHDYRTVLQLKEQLERANAMILGIVFCRADKKCYTSYLNYQKYCKRGLRNTPELAQLKIESKTEIREKVLKFI